VLPISEENCPPSHPVKGNQSGIYHDVDSPCYDATSSFASTSASVLPLSQNRFRAPPSFRVLVRGSEAPAQPLTSPAPGSNIHTV
jgi:hypothetical protein